MMAGEDDGIRLSLIDSYISHLYKISTLTKMIKLILSLTFLLLTSITMAATTPEELNIKLDLNEIQKNGTVSSEHGISYAGQPSESDFKLFADSGYKTVIDIRGVNENRGLNEQAVVSSLGMSYVLLPIVSGDDISFENADKLDQIIANSEGPILLHCASSNRVGALLALSEKQKGTENATALKIGKAAGLSSLEPIVIKMLNSKD